MVQTDTKMKRAVILEPRDQSMVLWTLGFSDEVRPAECYFEEIDSGSERDALPLVEMAYQAKNDTLVAYTSTAHAWGHDRTPHQ
jgi:non-homologous end joining protein Ku